MKKRIAIIGVGLSGLTLARQLSQTADVTIFEKARGVGGRMATRYAEPYYFDHGTQFFTVRTQAFKNFIKPYLQSGLVAEWKGKAITFQADKKITDRLWFEPHYVACPNMNSLCKKLSEGMLINLGCELGPLTTKHSDVWSIKDKNGRDLGAFDLVISTAPPEQTLKLFGQHIPEGAPFKNRPLQGCYTLMLGFNKSWDKSWIAAKVHDSPIEWIAINSTKPARNSNVTCIVVHTNNAWAEQHIDDDLKQVEDYLKSQFELNTNIKCVSSDYASLHRWRYALLNEEEAVAPYFDCRAGLASTGDWCTASRIEDVWSSAMELARQIQREL